MSVLILIGAVQGLFLAFALVLMRRGNRRANLFLAGALLVASSTLFDGFLYITNNYGRYSILTGVVWPVAFLAGPFLYFYIRELTLPKRVVLSWRQSLHFLPAIVSTLLFIFFYRMNENEGIPRLPLPITPLDDIHNPVLKAWFLLAFLQQTVYAVLSFLLIRTYSSEIKQSFSSLEKINLSWLRTLVLSFFCILFLLVSFSTIAAHLGINRETGYLFYMGMAFVIYIMAFKALLQPEIFSRIEVAHQVELIRTEQIMVPSVTASSPDQQEEFGSLSKKKYQRTCLTEDRAAEIARQLLQLMETKKFYLEPELTLPQFADRLSVSPNDLSQVINQEMKKSFFDFVNEYRVQEAKRILNAPEYGHYSVLGIALDAGFNSKSAFYTAFGKYVGMTPSEFRKQLGQ